MPSKCDVAILDADFAIKVGRFKNVNIIEEIIPRFVEVLYIHKYVYDNEILTPPIAQRHPRSVCPPGLRMSRR